MDKSYLHRAYVYSTDTCSQALDLLVAHCWHAHLSSIAEWRGGKCRSFIPADGITSYDDYILTLTCGFVEDFEGETCHSLEAQFAGLMLFAAQSSDTYKHLMFKRAHEMCHDTCSATFAWVVNMLVPRDRFAGTGFTEVAQMKSLRLQLEGPVSPTGE